MMDRKELGVLFGGLRAAVTIADQDGRIIYMNDLAAEHYEDRGGERLLGTDLYDCHSPDSRKKIRTLYARYEAGDLAPTRYREATGDGLATGIILIPLVVDGHFQGVAELMWKERSELTFEA